MVYMIHSEDSTISSFGFGRVSHKLTPYMNTYLLKIRAAFTMVKKILMPLLLLNQLICLNFICNTCMILKFHVNNSIDQLSHVLHLLKYVISSSDFVYSSLYFFLFTVILTTSLPKVHSASNLKCEKN